MIKLLLSITLLLLAYNVQAETLYRSIDENGKVQYSDTPVKNAADTEKLNSTSEPAADDTLPFELRRAVEKFPVTLYVSGSCGTACNLARDYLTKRGVPFTEKSLGAPEDIDAFKKASGGDQIPTIQVGTKWTIGFLESQWSQALDTAGYPRSAPYGSHPGAKPTPPVEKPKSE